MRVLIDLEHKTINRAVVEDGRLVMNLSDGSKFFLQVGERPEMKIEKPHGVAKL